MLLANRLRIEDVYRRHPEIDDQLVEGPLFIIGLPRTGTTALSQLVSADPQIRSLRLWESCDPVPPPESATEDTDPRIEETAGGLEAMYATFPRMGSMYFQTATGPTECQDLLGMEFRTAHFDGMAHVPSYTDWVLELRHGPRLPLPPAGAATAAMALPPSAVAPEDPGAHAGARRSARGLPRRPLPVDPPRPRRGPGLGVQPDGLHPELGERPGRHADLGHQQVELWAEALRRAMAFRSAVGEARFADIAFADLNADPVGTVQSAYDQLGLTLGADGRRHMAVWTEGNPRGAHGAHEYSIEEFGIDRESVRRRFSFYVDRFDIGDEATAK